MSVIIAVVPFIIGGSISSAAALGGIVGEILQNSGNTNEKRIVLKTTIRNADLLKKTLFNLGAKNVNNSSSQIQGLIDQFHIVFEQDKDGTLSVRFEGEIELEEAKKFVDELQNEYGKVVQEFVYVKLKEKAVEKGLDLEQEKVQNDQSIVLTYNING